jgi:hypothetical protein
MKLLSLSQNYAFANLYPADTIHSQGQRTIMKFSLAFALLPCAAASGALRGIFHEASAAARSLAMSTTTTTTSGMNMNNGGGKPAPTSSTMVRFERRFAFIIVCFVS